MERHAYTTSDIWCDSPVITRFEVSVLRDILDEVSSSSFVTIFDVSEIIGNHIKSVPNKVN